MPQFETIRLETDHRGVAVVTLNRPEKHNAMSAQMIGELREVADQLAGDKSVRAVVLTGEGGSFCAGGDLNWMKEQFAATRDQRISGARALAHMLRAINELPKPVIGRINGQAYGGGIGLISVCDVSIAVDSANFGLTEVRLGMIPATISPYVLARMGESHARKVFFSARIFTAAEAREMNLVTEVVNQAHLDQATEAQLAPYFAAAPEAVATAKRLTRRFGMRIDDDAIEFTIKALADTWEGAEAQEGISAFLTRQKPSWTKQEL